MQIIGFAGEADGLETQLADQQYQREQEKDDEFHDDGY